MEAFILAAGLGTRLRPLTDRLPKALVEVGGVPVLERVARRLVAAGCTRLVINAHHHAEQIRRFVAARGGFGVETLLSVEEERPLETGGGLLRAAPLFRARGPLLMHNADIVTDLSLERLLEAHAASGALATLAVRPLETPRYLAFDADGRLCGYGNHATGYEHLVGEPEGVQRVDFCGVQALDPRLLGMIREKGVFSIIKTYLRLAESGEAVRMHSVAPEALWLDIGTPEQLARAQALFSGGGPGA